MTTTVILASLRAALRLSPRQFAYHLKRKFRNIFAQRFPAAYARHIARITQSVPPLNMAFSGNSTQALHLAGLVAPFYLDEYAHAIDDAARGRFTFFEQSVDFGSPHAIDWHHQIPAESDFHLWRMKLGHMGFISSMLVDGDERHLDAVGELLASYRDGSDFGVPGCFSSYWFPYSVSHRILAILSGYAIAIERRPIPEPLRSEIEAFLQWNVGFLLVNVEHELRNNHVERNLAALCLYFSFVEAVPSRVRRRLDREVRRVIDACVLPDGFMTERSAMYQGLAVMALGVFADTEFLSSATRSFAKERHGCATSAWLTMTHPDGEIALFNDSWFGEVPKARRIVTDPAVQPVGLLPDAGYVRLEADGVFVLMDAGPIGPRWNPGHGHADFLALEVDVAEQRFLVDPGTFQYSTGPRRAYERSSRSHNGPVRVGVEPVEYLGCFRVGRMCAAEITSHAPDGTAGAASGRLSLPDSTTVTRTIDVTDSVVRVKDYWSNTGVGGQVRLTIPDEWTLDRHSEQRVVFRRGSEAAELTLVEGRIASVETGEWASNYLASRAAHLIDLQPDPSADGCDRLTWEIRASSDFLSEQRTNAQMDG